MSTLRLAARIATREARRRPARSLLVIFLVALPVAGMTVATTIIRTEARTPLRIFEDQFGAADIGFNSFAAPGTGSDVEGIDRALELAPPGTEIFTLGVSTIGLRNATETAYADVYSGDATAPIVGERYRLVQGRTTRDGGEVAVSPGTATRFEVGVGDRLVLERPSVEFDVVGIIEDTRHLGAQALHFSDGAPRPLSDPVGRSVRVLLDVPGTIDVDRALEILDARDSGAASFSYFEIRPTPEIVDEVLERYPWLADERDTAVRWSIVAGALVLAAVGIIIAAAFTVGARQQLTTLGQLSANGAPERLLRRVLVLQGTVTGLSGSVVGVVVASVGLRLARGPMERLADHRMQAFETRLSDVAAIVAVGVIGASVAALIPARSAARIPTLRALAGRRPEESVSRRTTGSGVVAFVTGLAVLAVATVGGGDGGNTNLWAGVAIVGGLGVLFGATATTPAIVAAVAPLAGRTRGVARIAVRNLTRHRTRTGAVVAAVATAGALAVGGATVSRTSVAEVNAYTTIPPDVVLLSGQVNGVNHQRPPARAIAQVANVLPRAERRQLSVARVPIDVVYPTSMEHGFQTTDAVVVDDDTAASLRLSNDLRQALDEDGIALVRFVDDEIAGDPVSVTIGDDAPVTAQLVFSRYSLGFGTGLYVTPSFARQRALSTEPGPLLFDLPEPVTEIQRFDLDEARFRSYQATEVNGQAPSIDETLVIDYSVESNAISRRVVETLLATTATLLALIGLAIGLALASADDREEATTLTVVGASPRVRSLATATKAWIMATLGFLLAIPIGFLPVKVVRSSTDFAASAPFPTATVAALVLLAPAVAALLTLVVSTAVGRLRPLRMSTAMFD